MKKKVSYIAFIICTLAVALFWNNDIARTLLSFELLLVPCLFILSVYLERNLSASLVVPDRYVPKGEKFEVDVHVSNASVIPFGSRRQISAIFPISISCFSSAHCTVSAICHTLITNRSYAPFQTAAALCRFFARTDFIVIQLVFVPHLNR